MAVPSPAQRSAASKKAWIKRRVNDALRRAGAIPGTLPRPRAPKPPRSCRCGCGLPVTGRSRFYTGHQASRQRKVRRCACGCGQQMFNRKRYLTGHKPKRRRALAVFKRPPSPVVLLMKSLVGIEQAVGLKLQEQALTDDQRKKYDRYQDLKRVALGGINASTPEMQNEARVALKFAVAQLLDVVKLVF